MILRIRHIRRRRSTSRVVVTPLDGYFEEGLQTVVRVHTTYECLDRTLPFYPKMLLNTPSIPWPSRVLDFSTTFLCL